MTDACSGGKDTNISALSPFSDLRVLDAIRRNMTAAKDRSYRNCG